MILVLVGCGGTVTEDGPDTSVRDSSVTGVDAMQESGVDASDATQGSDAAATMKVAFLSSTTYQGKLDGGGGLAAADAICNQLAKSAGLSGTFKAWLSDGTDGGNPAASFSHPQLPYVRRDGYVVANGWTDLVSGSLQHPLQVDEKNNLVQYPYQAWTNTTVSGTTWDSDFSCWGWTGGQEGGVGDPTQTDAAWTSRCCSPTCWEYAHLYCFEQ
jgi:hypothetical protein